MCGIAGLIEKKAARFPTEVLEQMSLKIAHRGPDGSGLKVYAEENLGLAHRRLAIIDLSAAAAQPMLLDDRYCMVFNGEIYNYLEIRNLLIEKGVVFTTNSDAEVLLKAYHFWGTSCLEQLDGMWAFCIFDRLQQILFCARDPFGVKPFYYVNTPEHFGFASEIKSLLCIPSYKAAVNPKAVADFLANAQIEMESEGFFKGVFELPPGHHMSYSFKDQDFKIAPYKRNQEMPYTDTQDALNEAVKRRLRADVPIGFCLSGGLDSSTLLAISKDIQNKESVESLSNGISAFTAVHDSPLDERSWAQKMVDQTKVDWIQQEVNAKGLIDSFEKIIYHQDIPLLTSSTYAQSAVMQAAAQQNIKILLDGQGGDELFAGYQVFYPTFLKELLLKGKFVKFIKEWRHLDNSPTHKKYILKEWSQDVLSILPPSIVRGLFSRKKIALQYLTDFEIPKRKRYSSLQKHLKAYREGPALKGLLRWEDRCSMQYGIESRTPFADALFLVKAVENLAPEKLIVNGWSKYALRTAVQDILPLEITWRKDKKGFSVPQAQWLHQTSTYWINLLQTKKDLDPLKMVDWEKLIQDAPAILSTDQENPAQEFLFRCCSYLTWLEVFNLGKLPASR
ncbi:MAG: asparagine synthase [Bacteroidota bacterium]|jgi:asparagine synthase (glutamine-hydrolysing)